MKKRMVSENWSIADAVFSGSKSGLSKWFFVLLGVLALNISAVSQDTLRMDLDEVLELAGKQSLEAFKAENVYMASYWEYKAFKSSLLPQASLRVRPFTFNRAMTQRYDINQNIEVFREQQTLNSYANLSVNQNIGITGGKVYVDSDFNRLLNFNADGLETYSLTPVRIGVVQPMFAFNETKWLHKLEPLKFEHARKAFIREQQIINRTVVGLYFDLLLAIKRSEMAKSNLKSAQELHDIGRKRFALTTIDKESLLNLELSMQNATTDLVMANKEIARARFNLSSFLRLDQAVVLFPEIPEETLGLQIDAMEAVGYALESNPTLLELRRTRLEAERDLERTVKEGNLNIDLTASFGLNQQADDPSQLYTDMLDQEMVAIDVSMPLLDWGQRKGRKEMALRRKEVAEIEITQAKSDFEQEVTLQAIDFNLQEQLVRTSKKSEIIALESYQLTESRFRTGNADVLTLTSAVNARQNAQENYINNLKLYWQHYYRLQQLTLYDFRNQRPLSASFEEFHP
ncbi:TolC family protein [Marinoscillum furvescens]|uniref:Outer membrane efflux protein n=1 Tax=Marinoscillum furvescens DSM 4134 TaxID=1122208 RepID=A0A3D9KZ34_MARFU|nr:TolC family protein [Marinoscillum furvescens]RED94937.1 outer membrane efflux protein [Marinoscillum furvescens DSM 4134]